MEGKGKAACVNREKREITVMFFKRESLDGGKERNVQIEIYAYK